MRRLLVVLLAAVTLAGCASAPDRDRNIAIGVLAGAAVGAAIASGGGSSVLTGAAIGGATGGVIGALIRDPACYVRNRRGEIWQVPCMPRARYAYNTCYVGTSVSSLTEVDCPRRY